MGQIYIVRFEGLGHKNIVLIFNFKSAINLFDF